MFISLNNVFTEAINVHLESLHVLSVVFQFVLRNINAVLEYREYP